MGFFLKAEIFSFLFSGGYCDLLSGFFLQSSTNWFKKKHWIEQMKTMCHKSWWINAYNPQRKKVINETCTLMRP